MYSLENAKRHDPGCRLTFWTPASPLAARVDPEAPDGGVGAVRRADAEAHAEDLALHRGGAPRAREALGLVELERPGVEDGAAARAKRRVSRAYELGYPRVRLLCRDA